MVTSVAISKDGQTLVSGSQDDTIKVWNLETGELLRTLEINTRDIIGDIGHVTINHVIISSDKNTIVSSITIGGISVIKAWDFKNGESLFTIKENGSVNGMIQNGKYIFYQSVDAGNFTFKVLNVKTKKLVKVYSLKELNRSHSFAISPDRNHVIIRDKDNMIKVWNLKTEKLVHTLKGQGEFIDIALSSDWTLDKKDFVSVKYTLN